MLQPYAVSGIFVEIIADSIFWPPVLPRTADEIAGFYLAEQALQPKR
jgi:hypothetical protein